MNSITELSGQLLGLWLAIIGIAIVFGVLFAIAGFLSRWKWHRGGADHEKTN